MIHGQINHTFFFYKARVFYTAEHLSFVPFMVNSQKAQLLQKSCDLWSLCKFHMCSLAHTYSTMSSWQLLEQFGQTAEGLSVAEGEMSKMQSL